jgi:hypothetical protein
MQRRQLTYLHNVHILLSTECLESTWSEAKMTKKQYLSIMAKIECLESTWSEAKTTKKQYLSIMAKIECLESLLQIKTSRCQKDNAKKTNYEI